MLSPSYPPRLVSLRILISSVVHVVIWLLQFIYHELCAFQLKQDYSNLIYDLNLMKLFIQRYLSVYCWMALGSCLRWWCFFLSQSWMILLDGRVIGVWVTCGLWPSAPHIVVRNVLTLLWWPLQTCFHLIWKIKSTSAFFWLWRYIWPIFSVFLA